MELTYLSKEQKIQTTWDWAGIKPKSMPPGVRLILLRSI